MKSKIFYTIGLTQVLLSCCYATNRLPNPYQFTNLAKPEALSTNITGVSEVCALHWSDFLLRLKFPIQLVSNEEAFWASKMYDAFGKQPIEGRFQGSFWAIGNAESCREVYAEHPHPVQDHKPFQGKYCLTAQSFELPESPGTEILRAPPFLGPGAVPPLGLIVQQALIASFMVKQGVCFPDTCSNTDIHLILNDFAAGISDDSVVTFHYDLLNCDGDIDTDFTTGDIIMIVIFSIFAFCMLVGLLLDSYSRLSDKTLKGTWQLLLLGFSPYTNIMSFNGQPKDARDHLTCLNGIRVLSMTWVVVCHVTMYSLFLLPINNFYYFMNDYMDGFAFRVILNGFPSVDSFYAMSGVLVGYLTFKELDRTKGRLNLPVFYAHRYIRLTGVYAVIVLFHATLLRFVPQAGISSIPLYVEECRENWWKNLLYINNFYRSDCLTHSWYMATEMQLFVASPFMIVPMWWIHKKWGKFWTALWALGWLLAFTVLILILQIIHKWPATMFSGSSSSNYTYDNYEKPWTRSQPYIVGIITGFILHLYRGKHIYIKRWVNVGIWLVAFGAGLSIVYALDTYGTFSGDDLTEVENAFYGVLYRLAWGLGLCWVIFACSKGYGGWINQFLSWEAFSPLSKLTYIIFLIHYTVLTILISAFTYRLEMTHYLTAILCLAFLFYVSAASLVTHLGIEVPLLNADKMFFKWLLSWRGAKKAE